MADTDAVQMFQALYQEYSGLIHSYVFRSVKSREDAEDLTAQIFLKVLLAMDWERKPLTREKWLFQVMRTTLADYFRSRAHTPTCSLEALLERGWECSTEDGKVKEADASVVQRVQQLLQALPSSYRDVLTYRFLLACSIRETARRMGVTEANVKILQWRALKRAAVLADARN